MARNIARGKRRSSGSTLNQSASRQDGRPLDTAGADATAAVAGDVAAVGDDLDNHLDDVANPHATTAAQVGAPTTAAFAAHVADVANPHAVTKAQVGLALVPNLDTTTAVAHPARTDNPHAVTKLQVGLGNVPDLDTTAAITASHARQHAIDAGADHTGVAGAVLDNLVAFDAAGLPKDAGIASSDVADTVAAVAAGVSGTFTTADLKTVTVTDGVITSIV